MAAERPTAGRQARGWGAQHVDGGSLPAPAPALVAPELCTLQPPAAGFAVHQLLAGAPPAASGTVRGDQWLRQLAGLVRTGQTSPERALLAACIYGEGIGAALGREPARDARELVKGAG